MIDEFAVALAGLQLQIDAARVGLSVAGVRMLEVACA